jgi:hypothetical protein
MMQVVDGRRVDWDGQDAADGGGIALRVDDGEAAGIPGSSGNV